MKKNHKVKKTSSIIKYEKDYVKIFIPMKTKMNLAHWS